MTKTKALALIDDAYKALERDFADFERLSAGERLSYDVSPEAHRRNKELALQTKLEFEQLRRDIQEYFPSEYLVAYLLNN